MGLIGGHLARLFDVAGRENRQPFWLWVLIVYAVMMVIGMLVMIPMMASAFGGVSSLAGGDQTYLNQHPEIIQQAMMQALVPAMQNMIWVSLGMTLVMVLLLAAALIRRLHDGNRSGWWGLLSLLLQVATMASYLTVMPRYFSIFTVIQPGMTPDQINLRMATLMQSTAWVSLLGMVNLLVTIVLIVFLALPGTAGPNRYGDDPLERVPGVSSWRQPPTSRV